MTTQQKSLLKYAFAFTLLALILRKMNMEEILGYFQKISPLNLLSALTFVTLAQCAAALRMRFFFLQSGFVIHRKFAIILFYVGSFYNFLLPGGIGGDAYKVIIAHKRFNMPHKTGIRVMIADRASGLCVLILMMLLATYLIDLSNFIPYFTLLLVTAVIITIIGFLACSFILLKQPPKTMLISLPYACVTQGLWVMTLYDLWESLGEGKDFICYLGLYCASSIASMLPVSVGGLGIKEMTYFYGADFLNHHASVVVDKHLGVAISLCIFAISFVASLPGILWLNSVNKAEI